MISDHATDVYIPQNNEGDDTDSETNTGVTLRVARSFGDFYFKQNRNIPPEAQIICAFPEVEYILIRYCKKIRYIWIG